MAPTPSTPRGSSRGLARPTDRSRTPSNWPAAWPAPKAAPRRLLLVFSSGGMVPEKYWPEGTENEFSFVEGSSLEPIAPFKDDLVVIKGIGRKMLPLGGAHERAMGALWTGCK